MFGVVVEEVATKVCCLSTRHPETPSKSHGYLHIGVGARVCVPGRAICR